MTTTALQLALIARGYSVGSAGADGVFGRATISAVKAFQADHGLSVDGIAGPKTLFALDAGKAAGILPASPLFIPWFEEAKRKQGLHEIRDKAKLAACLKSDGATLGDPSKLPWCGSKQG
ncbi:peptidoglycan-binding domain-containing protein [Flaviflagellibacter deserti]|uniref:Peptidoglycan-binding protein n=1 Tax=Flaviflagellibacter deserti TaxID=2267266 RepID=A0ABV9YZL6_9HYPH